MAATISHTQPFPHHTFHKPSLHSSKTSGSSTSLNASPTSPRTSFQLPLLGQHATPLRPLKTPNYIPAALRKTEKPSRHSPPKNDGCQNDHPLWNVNSPMRPRPDDIVTTTPLAGEDMHSIYNDVPLSPLAGPVTRNHWQPDTSTFTCTALSCQQTFGLFNRRHHCRKCGGIFCAQHSTKTTRLNEHALFHPQGDWQRSCDRCFSHFREWEMLRSSRTNSESSGSISALPIEQSPAKRPEANRVGSLATSFGGNWNWSTF